MIPANASVKNPLLKMNCFTKKDIDLEQKAYYVDDNSVLVKLDTIRQFTKIYKISIIILSCVAILVILGTARISAPYLAVHDYFGNNLANDNFRTENPDLLASASNFRKKRDANKCSQEELSKCKKMWKAMYELSDHQQFRQQFRSRYRTHAARCMECENMDETTTASYETTTKQSARSQYSEIKSFLRKEMAGGRNSDIDSNTEGYAEESTLEAESNETESTTEMDKAVSDSTAANGMRKGIVNGSEEVAASSTESAAGSGDGVNGEGQSNVTEIPSSRKSSNCDDTRGRSRSGNVQGGRTDSGSTDDNGSPSSETMPAGESATNAQMTHINHWMVPLPCYIFNGLIYQNENDFNSARLNGISNNNPNSLQSYDGKADQGFPSKGPIFCQYYNPHAVPPTMPDQVNAPPASQNSASKSEGRSFQRQNMWPSFNYRNLEQKNELNCPETSYACVDKSRCVSKAKWCNGNVDCPDASDETNCNCKYRIPPHRLCDGYFDCPQGEDELGCHGCNENSFICNVFEKNGNESNCIPIDKRCDGVMQCKNGKDEDDCLILTNEDRITNVGFTSGYLHKNHKGQWYAVKSNSEAWIMEACQSNTGLLPNKATVAVETDSDHTEQCIIETKDGHFEIVPKCNEVTHVVCHELECGTRLITSYELNQSKRRSRTVRKNNNVVNQKNDFVGIVGGRASAPKAWPFLAYIASPDWICGGTIIDSKWILTAAHCLVNVQEKYVQITVGMLRVNSFSPTTQVREAKSVFIHPKFNENEMTNDIALILLSENLQFNLWVRPVCLPSVSNNSFVNGPKPGTLCKVIGWGATTEGGSVVDHLREVSVKIAPECLHEEDKHEGNICAGYMRGGKDSCRGDSGGPLLCKNDNEHQWYVAGLVSHGTGCAKPNELGVYTRIKYYSSWIEETMQNPSNSSDTISVSSKCPGFVCKSPPRQCILKEEVCDKRVHCLDAEDEINCSSRGRTIETHNYDEYDDNSDEAEKCSNDKDKGNKHISENVIEDSEKPHQENNKTNRKMPYKYRKIYTDMENIRPIATTDENSTPQDTSMLEDDYDSATDSFREAGPTKIEIPQSFSCKIMQQQIKLDQRCDKKYDCEDGTDEQDCTSKDYLLNKNPKLVCNGHYDTKDLTDEDGTCEQCAEDEFKCIRSGTCIHVNLRCNEEEDCPHGEDEQDCITLTDGKSIYMDFDGRPSLQISGMTTVYSNGHWLPSCLEDDVVNNETQRAILAKNICTYIGYSNAKKSEVVETPDKELQLISSNVYVKHEANLTLDGSENGEGGKECKVLKITCEATLQSNSIDEISYQLPWQAAIFVEGQFHCSAIILDHRWLLATNNCLQNISVETNYTIAMLGLSTSYKIVDGPYQQTIPIDNLRAVEGSKAILLHLKESMNLTRYVQPIFTNKKIFPPSNEENCIALAENTKLDTETFVLKSVVDNCDHCSRCFILHEEYNTTLYDNVNKWSGTISCLGSGGWYPAAIFNDLTLSDFDTPLSLTSIDFISAHINKEMDEHSFAESKFECSGVRCSLGNCVPLSKVCNNLKDCRDGSDEQSNDCYKAQHFRKGKPMGVECGPNEIRCNNGQCTLKKYFCDGSNDCDDSSDELNECNCAAYLQMTKPSLICDGKRDCFDKSDEEDCGCSPKNAFCQGRNNESLCITMEHDYICDDDFDCEDKLDEQFCLTIKPFDTNKPNIGELVKTSYGKTHPFCHLSTVTDKTADFYCKKLHYQTGKLTTATPEFLLPLSIPEGLVFSTIHVNDEIVLRIRDDEQASEYVPETCNRVILECQLSRF